MMQRFEFVTRMHQQGIPVSCACENTAVSSSGYYEWVARDTSEQAAAMVEFENLVVQLHVDSRCSYGAARVHESLLEMDIKLSVRTVGRALQRAGINACARKQYVLKTTDSNHSNPIAERLFKSEDKSTHPTKPNQVWMTDISYIPTREGFVYFCMYIDGFTKKYVGYSLENHMRTSMVVDALKMAIKRQNCELTGLIVHSDRGTQYASMEMAEFLAPTGMIKSMSRKGNCYDNAVGESSHATLKKELVYKHDFQTKQEAKTKIIDYIENFYNPVRMHSTLGLKSPIQFEKQCLAA